MSPPPIVKPAIPVTFGAFGAYRFALPPGAYIFPFRATQPSHRAIQPRPLVLGAILFSRSRPRLRSIRVYFTFSRVVAQQVLEYLAYRVPVGQLPSPSLPRLCLLSSSVLLRYKRGYLLVPFYISTLRAHVSFAVRYFTLSFLFSAALTRLPRRCRP